ncbi:MAG: hypothetical protein H0T76_10130 [Nannocystis sp.]|nr:hypothetical protein [Nannocystis sp.]
MLLGAPFQRRAQAVGLLRDRSREARGEEVRRLQGEAAAILVLAAEVEERVVDAVYAAVTDDMIGDLAARAR